VSDLVTNLDRYGCSDEARVKAMWFLYRTGNRDLWEVLGLVDDPVAGAARAARALREMSGGHVPAPVVRPGYCPICQNKVTYSSPCRRTKACREAFARAEVAAAQRIADLTASPEEGT
jgi:hypothetical protein